MKRVLLDCDGVLADFSAALIREASKHGVVFGIDDWTTWDAGFELCGDVRAHVEAAIDGPGWCLGIPAYMDSGHFVQRLRGLADVHVVTSAWRSSHWHAERLEWLKRYAGIDHKRVTFTHDKFMVRGDALIDDRLSHIVDWSAANPDGIGILVDCPYNQGDLPPNAVRTHSYDQILSVVGGL